MSIFGESTSDISNSSSPAENPNEDFHEDFIDDTNLISVQSPRNFDTFIEDELGHTDASNHDAQEGSSDYNIDQYDRLNRFEGTAQRWRQLTQEERGLAASLEQIRAGDLSSHLYNVYALKKTIQRHDEETNSDSGHDSDEHDTLRGRGKKRRRWTPGANWTAWPMQPELVPQPSEHYGIHPEDPQPDGNPDRGATTPENELRKQLEALLQKQAKERWAIEGGSINPPDIDLSTEQSAHDDEGLCVLADDDEAHHLLDPAVRSVLAKVDELLLALHHSRTGVFEVTHATSQKYNRSNGEASIEEDQEAEVSGLERSQSMGRSSAASDERSKSTFGRPKIYNKRADETYYQMHKRLAIERSRSRGGNDSPAGQYAQLPIDGDYYGMYKRLAQGTEGPAMRDGILESARDINAKRSRIGSKPRDWSQVLNMAAQRGFSDAAVRRAAKRCGELFGESMSFRTLDYTSAMELIKPGDVSHQAESQMAKPPSSRTRPRHGSIASEAERRLRCPVEGCLWHTKRFAAARVRDKHVLTAHGREVLVEHSSENVLVGGVHLDGFLQVIAGSGRRKATDT